MNPLSDWHQGTRTNWPMVPLRGVAALGTGHTPDRTNPEYWENCIIPWVTAADLSTRPSEFEPLTDTSQYVSLLGIANSSAVVHPAETVMFCRTASVGLLTITGKPMATTQAFVTWTAGPSLLPRYLLFVVAAMRPELMRIAYGSTHLTIYMPDLKALEIPLPPLDEQRRIVDFLDDQVARLDTAIALKHRQIALLRTRELSEIAATLRGDEHSQRQDTGIDWFPSLASHWSFGRVSSYFDVQLGKMLNEERTRGRNLAPYLRNANIHWFTISTSDMALMNFEPHEHSRYSVERGDLLVCEGGAGVAEAAVWDGSIKPCFFSKSLHRVRPRRHVPSTWLMFWLRLVKHAGVLEAEGNLSTIPHLTGEQLQAMRIPIPAVGEGSLLHLEERMTRIDELRKAATRSIALLEERKQALITAAVTGQIDVTTARSVA